MRKIIYFNITLNNYEILSNSLINLFVLILVPPATEALSATATLIMIIFKTSLKCLFRSLLRGVIDNAGIVNPHIIVETIAWNVLMEATTAEKIV